MRTLQPIAARLAHDVGKYVARTARNLSPPFASLPSPLHAMLLQDLYGEPQRSHDRPKTRFLTLAEKLDEPRLLQVRKLFDALDQIEESVRAGDASAVENAVKSALQIEELLRALARDARGQASAKKGPP